MSLPADIVDDVRTRKGLTDSGSPAFDQIALARLVSTGEDDRHIARARLAYRRRRDVLVAALAAELPGLPITGAAAGMHVLLDLLDAIDDTAVAAAAASRGIGVTALSTLYMTTRPHGHATRTRTALGLRATDRNPHRGRCTRARLGA